MTARKNKSTFKGCDGFPTIKQDFLALPRCVFIGSVVADRDAYRAGRPGMGTLDFARIEDETERENYKRLVNLLRRSLQAPSTQTKNMLDFWRHFNLDLNWIGEKDIEVIQECLKDHYRIILFNYHSKSGMCSLKWAGEEVRAKMIILITDGEKWDVLSKKSGIHEGDFFCGGCLSRSHVISAHRCSYTCPSCNSLLAIGNCEGDLNKRCEECNFIFQTEKCFQLHRFERREGGGSRCQTLRYCYSCRSIYRARFGPHNCTDNMIYCTLCSQYTPSIHDCHWSELSTRTRAKLQKEQLEWKIAFWDCETQQVIEDDNGDFEYTEHVCTTIVLIKVCYKCHDKPIDEYCEICHTREVIFNYDPLNPDEDDFKVMDEFCEFLVSDDTMTGRQLYAHNSGRFDSHLAIAGFIRMGIPPSMVNRGTNVLRAEFRLRGNRKIVLKDSYAIVPMALGQFAKAFELDCDGKGQFPHFSNSRRHRGRTWSSVPDRRYFGYRYLKEEAQVEFDRWYEPLVGKEWQQEERLIDYCRNDVIVLMRGCLKYNEIMMKEHGWSPFTVAITLASYVQFVLRANHLNHKDFPYIPESGYGALNQSKLAILYFKYLEKKHPERVYQHAHSPYGEQVVYVNNQRYSVDCLVDGKKIIEIHGCYFHGCFSCYAPGSLLVGNEPARNLLARSEYRISQLRTKFEVVTRLSIRSSLFGGRVEVFRSYLKATEDTVIKYYDIVSMYPFVQATMPFPLGPPRVITSGFLPVTGTKLPYRGIYKVRVICPRSLKLAILPVRHDSFLIFGNCISCIRGRIEHCTHEDENERSWVATYCSVELEKALEHGYRIVKIFEVYAWDRFDDTVYKSYFRKCMRLKFAASPFPPGVENDDQKAEYCKRVGAKLGFTLLPQDVAPSAAARNVAKLTANSAWGKLCEVPTHSQTEYLSCEGFKDLRLNASREIIDAKVVEYDLILATHRPLKETIRANRFSSVAHSVFVTCYARCLLYDVLAAVGPASLGYCDTDSVIFEMPRGGPDPLAHMLNGEFGNLSDELADGWEIVDAVMAGCKNYTISMVNRTTGETATKRALRGITKDANALSILTHERMRDMVIKKNDPEMPEFIEIERVELKRKMGKITSQTQKKKWKPVSKKRATRGEGTNERKIPFGCVEEDAD